MNSYFVWNKTPDQLTALARFNESDIPTMIASSGRVGVAPERGWRDLADVSTVEYQGKLYTPTLGALELSYAINRRRRFGGGVSPLDVARQARRAGILKDVIAGVRAIQSRDNR